MEVDRNRVGRPSPPPGPVRSPGRPLALLAAASFLALGIGISSIGRGSTAPHLEHSGAASDLDTPVLLLWTLPPAEISALVVLAALYALATRGRGVPWRRQVSFYGGLGVVALAVTSPIAVASQQGLFAAHMLQHTLIGALAPLLVLLGIPPVIARGLGASATRRVVRLQHPVVALGLWLGGTVLWLLPAVHEAILGNPTLWVVQQFLFFFLGLALWAPIVETLPAPRWFGSAPKLLYLTVVWFVGVGIANVYWFAGTPFYGSHSLIASRWGVSPLEDQANGGTVMLVLHCLVAFGAITVLFFRHAREGEIAQRLLEAGVDPLEVSHARREGRSAALALRHGLTARTRPGID